jgi:intraflagellar transport protein 52
VTAEKLAGARVVAFAGPRAKFTAAEFEALKAHLARGGGVLLLLGEGGEARADTNVNFLLEQCGVAVNADAVVRSVYYKFPHPKEVVVAQGVVNREVLRVLGKAATAGDDAPGAEPPRLSFVYPFGSTLTVQKPAVAVLSTGPVSLPVNRPVCAFYQHPVREPEGAGARASPD